jgi:hypothetical protein
MAFGPPSIKPATRPMQVQFFRDTDLAALQDEINDWLAKHPRAEVADVRQTPVVKAGETEIVISVWYIDD